MFLVIDETGQIREANARVRVVFDYAPQELIGRPVELLIPGARPALRAMGHPAPLRGLRRDGTAISVDVRFTPFETSEGAMIIAVVRQAREHVPRVHDQDEECFRRAFEDAPVGIAWVGLDGHFLRVNRSLCGILGYEAVELASISFEQVTHPADLDIELTRKLREGEITHYAVDKRCVRKDGSLVHVSLNVGIVRDHPTQAPSYFVAHLEDVTERRNVRNATEAALQRSKALLDQAQQVARLGSWEWDLRTNEVVYSDGIYELFGLVPDSGPRRRWSFAEHLPKEERERIDRAIADAIRERHTYELEHRIVRADGEERMVFAKGRLVLENGEPRSMIGTILDITERKRAERERELALRELDRLRAEWSAVVAHDLRQPLHAIAVHAQLVAKSPTAGPDVRESVHRIHGSARRLDRMVQDLMDLSRLDARRLELTRARVDVGALVQSTVESVALGCVDRRFDVHVESDLPKLFIDADRLAQVMDNLLVNAVKYGEAETPIVVTATRVPRGVAISVTNRGPAVPPAQLALFFQRFQRGESASRGRVKGVGLGLYIARGLVEAHGGELEAESTEGTTTFRITLPMETAHRREGALAEPD